MVVATTLRYSDEVTEPSHFAELSNLPDPGDEELDLMTQIVDKLTVDLDLGIFHDSYKERIESLIKSRMKGKIAEVEEKRPKKRPWMIEPQRLPCISCLAHNIFLTLLIVPRL